MASEGKTKKMRLGVGMHPNALLMLIFVPTAVVLEDGPLDPRAQNARVSKLRLYECVLPSLQSALDGRRSEVDWHAQDNVAFTPAAHPSSRRLPRLDQSGVYVNCERLFDGARPEPDGWSWDAHSWSADHDSTDFQKEPSAERAKQHEAMEHIYDFLPVKLCGHACALNVPWKITCCGCDGVLPAHELVRKQRQDIRRHWVSQPCDAAQASCDDRDEDKRAPGDGIPSGALAASRGLTAELQRILAPFLPLIPQGRRIYNFLADDGAAEEETEKHDQNQARQHSGKLWSGRRRPPHAAFCWVCRLVDKLPPVFVALQALVSSSLPLRPCPPMLCFPGARGEQRERADTGEECECGDTLETPSGHATWSFSSHPRVMLPVVEESIWERAMARAGEVMGPWWLLRVLEPSSAQSLPHPVRACAGRDAVWFNICFAEGLVTRDLRPRVPFNSVLDGGLEWRDVGGDLDSGLFLHASADRGLFRQDHRGLFRQDSLPPSLPVWLHVYLESTQAQAAVKNVVGPSPPPPPLSSCLSPPLPASM
jgi:hypothetical protein